MHFCIKRFFLGFGLFTVATLSTTFAEAAPKATEEEEEPTPFAQFSPTEDQYHYTILRDEKPIGHYAFGVSYLGDEQHIGAHMDLKVKLAFITVYKAKYSGLMVYKHGKLLRHEGSATYNGKDYATAYSAATKQFSLNGKAAPLQGNVLAFTPFILGEGGTFFTEKGRQYAVNLTLQEAEPLTLNGVTHQTQHATLTGAMQRDLWYDEEGALLQAVYEKDGVTIRLVRE